MQTESVAPSMPAQECAAKSDRNLLAEYEFIVDFIVMLVWNLCQNNPTIYLTGLIRFRFRPVNERVARPTASPQAGD